MVIKNGKQIIAAYTLCGIFLFIVAFSHYIDVYFSFNYILSSLFVMTLLITMVVLFSRNIILAFKNGRQQRLKFYWPVLIYAATFLVSFIIPAEIFESKTILVAYHKGTQNQAIIKFKKDKTFEMNCTGVFGYNEWFTGNYKQRGDTLYLKYTQLKPRTFGEIVLNNDGKLIPLDKSKDSLYLQTFIIEKN